MIDLDTAKYHLRVFGTAEDAQIERLIGLAQAIVDDYIREASIGNAEKVTDAAVLLVLGELYLNREADADPLSESVRRLLERQRPVSV